MTETAAFLAPAVSEGDTAHGTPTVRAEGVHVRYRVYDDKRRGLRETLVRPWQPQRYREVHAVKGVSFTAHAGEAIGVIGANGSGKSSLMRVIAGLQPVTEGAVYARSTPMLLGVGAVLNKSLSGRRNILLGGLALGMSKAEILEREQSIISFAGIGYAIDLPMRTYSSGMAARLQFAISAAVEPEILIIDEALSVGDEDFRRKSNERIRELSQSAGTVFIVSHSMSSLRQTCTRVLWLDDGELRGDGAPKEIIRQYREPIRRRQRQAKRRRKQQRKREEGPAARGAPEPQEAAPAPSGTGQPTTSDPAAPQESVSAAQKR